MPIRTILLLVLLGVVAGGAWHFQHGKDAPVASEAAAKTSLPVEKPARPATPESAPSEDSRIEDHAEVLAPFVPRLERMAEDFHTDLGIDVRVVTTTEAEGTIETQSNETFERKQIGRDAAVGGLLIVLNPKLGKARIEVGYTLEGAL